MYLAFSLTIFSKVVQGTFISSAIRLLFVRVPLDLPDDSYVFFERQSFSLTLRHRAFMEENFLEVKMLETKP